jgi:peptidoglycan/xylan/chitin deacetylase (PgdA/CDA1 family)
MQGQVNNQVVQDQSLQGQVNNQVAQDQSMQGQVNNQVTYDQSLQGQYNPQVNIESLQNYIMSQPQYKQDQNLVQMVQTEQVPAIQSYVMGQPQYQEDQTLLNLLSLIQGQYSQGLDQVQNQANFDIQGLQNYIQSVPEYVQDQTLCDMANNQRVDELRNYIMSRPQYKRDQRLISFVINIRIRPNVRPIRPISPPSILPIVEPSILPIVEPSILPIVEPSILPIAEPSIQPVEEEIIEPVTRPAILPVQNDIQSLIGQRPEFGQIIRTCKVPGRLALTFDDGPIDCTSELLDILRNEGVRATFFVVGKNQGSSNWASLVRRIFQEGHQIGSHTLNHPNLDSLRTEERQNQMLQNDELIRAAIGVSPTYMRAPYDACGGECLSDISNMGYRVIGYNIDTNDWQGDLQAARSQYLSGLQAGNPRSDSFIALAHDIRRDTVSQLVPFMIQQARAMGYQFSTVGECLGEDQANWYRSGQGLLGGAQEEFVPTQGNFLGGAPGSIIGGQDIALGNVFGRRDVAQDITAY